MGVDPATLTAGASLVGAGTGLYGAATANNNAASTQASIANANLQNSENQQQYERALNTIAMQRSTAGTVDGQGGSTVFDPATNTWKTTLGPAERTVQNASNAASVGRNTTDQVTGQTANQDAVMRALMAARSAGPALAAVNNFKPMSVGGLEGALQQNATMANRQAEDPIIADTLRQFMRSGTAAGPVLTQMERGNADTLRKTVNEDTINAMTGVANVNNANRSGLVGTYQALNGAANPTLNFSPTSTQNPSDTLAAEAASRATSAGSVPEQGLFGTAMGTNATNTAAGEAIKTVPNSNMVPNQIAAIGKVIPSAVGGYNDLLKALTAGDNTQQYNPSGVTQYDPQSGNF